MRTKFETIGPRPGVSPLVARPRAGGDGDAAAPDTGGRRPGTSH